jgi:5-methylcytosine-specific restriction endonuclease McrA
MKTKKQQTIRKGTVPLSKVLSKIHARKKPRQKAVFLDEEVGVDSMRLNTFRRSPRCAGCGLRPRFFAVEKTMGENDRFHLNLYGIDDNGDEVLMTCDHVIPSSKGGRNSMVNTQTMCYPCNARKKDKTDAGTQDDTN